MKWSVGAKIASASALALLLIAINGIVSYRNATGFIASSAQAARSMEVLRKLESVLSNFKDAETGQRGFVITGADRYLEPFRSGISGVEQELKDLRNLATVPTISAVSTPSKS